jgi:D-alanyl-D-alanine carboxypeptidase/D-alanyl-D-alanine-endopeptidase (penicillin-binding protein 4)
MSRPPVHLFCIAALFLSSLALPAGAAAPHRHPAALAAASTPAALREQIDAHVRSPRFAAASWGVSVVSLDSGRVVYAHEADRLLQPASTAKLFTAALALSVLGTSYQMNTRLLGRSTRNGRLNGPLVLQGMGDPTLGTEQSADWANQLATQLHARGVTQVNGDLIADDSRFTGSPFGAGWEVSDLQSWFAVPSSALSVQENIVDVSITPATTAGSPASVVLSPVDAMPRVLGSITTTLARAASDINLYRGAGDTTLYVFGSIPLGSPPQHFRMAMPDPALEAGLQLRAALGRHGIHLSGQVRSLHWPQDNSSVLAGTETLGEVASPPMIDILQRGLKRSQNLYLQNLLLSVGVHEQPPANLSPAAFTDTASYSLRAMRHLLTEIGIAPSMAYLTEGTGLSRRDLITPAAMTRLLVFLAAQPYATQFRNALPVAGVDGTLVHRMHDTPAAGNVHAKTGSMSHVHCLAGYVTTASGERLAFDIMLDNYDATADAPSAGSDVDAIAVMLAGYRGR